MNNKRGQVFSLILVFITLALCGIVIGLYVVQNAEASLVSPRGVLELRDGLSIFEMMEVELIEKSLGDDGFDESFRSSFIDGVMNDENMKSFLFDDLFIGGVEVKEQDKNRDLLEKVVYSVSEGQGFSRAKIEKRFLMTAKEQEKIDFPVEFKFEFEREYLINEKGEVVKV